MKRFSTCCCSGCEIRINLSPEGINLTNVDVKSKLIGLYNPWGIYICSECSYQMF